MWRAWWAPTEYLTLFLQACVTFEALTLMSRTVRNFTWRWRLLAILCVPAIAAAALSRVESPYLQAAFLWNQIAGLGLGVVVAGAVAVGMAVRVVVSPRAIFHAGVVSMMWLLSGIGYRHYSQPFGPFLMEWCPVILMLLWAWRIGKYSDVVEDADPEKHSEDLRKLNRSTKAASK